MVRWEQAVIVCLFSLGLLAFMSIEPFTSERPYTAAQTRKGNASIHPQVNFHHILFFADSHISAALTCDDVTRWLNPTVSSLIQTTVEFSLAGGEVFILIMVIYWCCLLGVYLAIWKCQNIHRYNYTIMSV